MIARGTVPAIGTMAAKHRLQIRVGFGDDPSYMGHFILRRFSIPVAHFLFLPAVRLPDAAHSKAICVQQASIIRRQGGLHKRAAGVGGDRR